ncbi:MAG: response regulator [Anaerolineales bacterium]|nr:response regulator [Anaerolineales bacterium]
MKVNEMRPQPEDDPLETTYQELFDLAPVPQAIFNLEGACLLANRAFSNRLLPEGDFPSKRKVWFEDIVENRRSGKEFLRELGARQILRRWELNIIDPEHSVFPALVSGRLLAFRGEQAFEISIIDISRQKRLQNALRNEHLRLSSVIDNMAAGIFLVNQEGQITEINRYLAQLLSIAPDQLVRQPYQNLFAHLIRQTQDPVLVRQALHNITEELRKRPTLSFTIQKEKVLHLEAAFFPVLDDQDLLAGWGCLIRDSTDLQDQVSWRLELLSILAHDLRTPLATIQGHIGALVENFRHWNADMVREFLEGIEDGVNNLTHQVDQSLALTRVEAGHFGLHPEAVACESLVRESLERVARILPGTRVELHIPDDLPEVRVDPLRVEEVLINLLENAARYSPDDESIQIQARAEDNWVIITVADRGPGISENERTQIFKKYIRDPSELGGTGMGLYISRKIVEAHGGRIWVDSPPPGAERGAAFSFTLPVMPLLEEGKFVDRSSTFIGPLNIADAPRVLVIEDDPDTQVLLRTLLIEEGYQVEIVSDGPTGIDILQASPIDIVLLDWVLPGMRGLNICRSIRRWSEVPIMMVTSKTSQEDVAAALDAGADDYVTKPFVRSEIVARIRALLRRGESPAPAREKDRFSARGLIIDFETRQAWLGGDELVLTPTEYRLLAYLARNPRRVLTYGQLIDNVWGGDGVSRRGLFAHVSRLRNKLGADHNQPQFIATKWGVGYIFLPQNR